MQHNIILAIMKKFQKETFKVRILKLAILESTGTPADLALRFEISARSVKRMVKEIRDSGIIIWYCRLRRSYVTENKINNMLYNI
jgi:hypothetical protein